MKRRIKKIIEQEGLNVNKFSDIIGVNKSTMSHILSGRNNPSIDVLTKILKNFPLINANWLLLGYGEIYINNQIAKDDMKKDIKKIVVFYSDNSFHEFNA